MIGYFFGGNVLKIIIATIASTLVLTANAQAVFAPNNALSNFIEKQGFPKNIASREEVVASADWYNKASNDTFSFYLSRSLEGQGYCNTDLKNEFVNGTSYPDSKDKTYKPLTFSLTKQVIPNPNPPLNPLPNLEIEYGKIFKLFGQPYRVSRNQQMSLGMINPTNAIEVASYILKHHGKEVGVDFIITPRGCMQIRVDYLGLFHDAKRMAAENTRKSGDAISNVLK